MEPVIIAICGSLTALFSWRASVHSKGARRDVATNHGKRPGEHLESIEDLRVEVKSGFADLKTVLADHTLQDAENFAELSERITELQRKVAV